MESRRPRTERSALALTDLPRDPEALTRVEAEQVAGGNIYAWIQSALRAIRPIQTGGSSGDLSAKQQLKLTEANGIYQ